MKKLILMLVLSATFIMPAKADDDIKRLIGGLAAGVIGLALEEGAKASENQEQPVQNVQAALPFKLQYSKDVAEVQDKLKQAGHYKGAVDGLKGKNTIDAINEWETRYSVEAGDGRVNAMLSPDELSLLEQQIGGNGVKLASVDTPSSNDRPKKISEMKGANAQGDIYDDVVELVFYYKAGEACLDYKNQTGIFGDTHVTKKFNGQYRQYLDAELESIQNNAKSLEKQNIRATAQCSGVADQTLEGLYDKAEAEYDNSNNKINVTSASVAIIRGYPDVEEQFVDQCNLYAHELKKKYESLKNDDTGKCE